MCAAWEEQPAATGGIRVADAATAKATEPEALSVGEAVEDAVREREQRQWRGQRELLRRGTSLRTHGSKARAVHVGPEEAEHHAGQVPWDVRPRQWLFTARHASAIRVKPGKEQQYTRTTSTR